MGRQKLESSASSEIGNDSPYLHGGINLRGHSYVTVGSNYMTRIQIRHTTYSNSFSRKTTGSGSLIAALRRPRASSAEYGVRTFKPGTEAYHAA